MRGLGSSVRIPAFLTACLRLLQMVARHESIPIWLGQPGGIKTHVIVPSALQIREDHTLTKQLRAAARHGRGHFLLMTFKVRGATGLGWALLPAGALP